MIAIDILLWGLELTAKVLAVISLVLIWYLLSILWEDGLRIFKTPKDKLEAIGWEFEKEQTSFALLRKKNSIKLTTVYVELYFTGEINTYAIRGDNKTECVLTMRDYELLLKYMKNRGWPKIA
jgi:hypothetical protein